MPDEGSDTGQQRPGRRKIQPNSRPKAQWLVRDAWDDAYSNVIIDLVVKTSQIMEAENVAQVDLAERTGLTTKHVNQLLNGSSTSLRGFVYLLGALGYQIEVSAVRLPETCFESVEASRSSR